MPAFPGTLAREDDEYKRCGTANIFLCVEPLTGRVVVTATEHRAKIDFAHFIRDLCDGPYRHAEKLIVVMDNLNTHSLASLYEAFFPVQARRLVEKLEIHHTPKVSSPTYRLTHRTEKNPRILDDSSQRRVSYHFMAFHYGRRPH